MTHHHRRIGTALALTVALAACHPARQAPGMDAKDLSDDRGAGAGHFRSPANDSAAANATDPADNSMTVESNQ